MDTSTVDLFDPDTYLEGPPHEVFAELRRSDPVHWQPMAGDARGGCWAVLRHADVTEVARHPALYSASEGGVVVEELEPQQLEMMRMMLLAMDPPGHAEYRRPLLPHFNRQAMAALEQVASQALSREMGYTYSGLSYEEKNAPSPVPTFAMAVVFVFLLLAAVYESWSLPWAVLLGTPIVVLGAFFGIWLLNFPANVYVQIGLVMLIGLAAKNAILIVEFAKMSRDQGKPALDAALEAARLRFRPILMTAFAFIMGVIPLMLATGSGAASRAVMGTAVFFGMLVATLIGVFVYPALFVLVEFIAHRRRQPAPAEAPVTTAATEGPNGL